MTFRSLDINPNPTLGAQIHLFLSFQPPGHHSSQKTNPLRSFFTEFLSFFWAGDSFRHVFLDLLLGFHFRSRSSYFSQINQ